MPFWLALFIFRLRSLMVNLQISKFRCYHFDISNHCQSIYWPRRKQNEVQSIPWTLVIKPKSLPLRLAQYEFRCYHSHIVKYYKRIHTPTQIVVQLYTVHNKWQSQTNVNVYRRRTEQISKYSIWKSMWKLVHLASGSTGCWQQLQ